MALSDLLVEKEDILSETKGIKELNDLRNAVISADEAIDEAYSSCERAEHDCDEKEKELKSKYRDWNFDFTDIQVFTDAEGKAVVAGEYHYCIYTEPYDSFNKVKSCLAGITLDDSLAVAKALSNNAAIFNDNAEQAKQEVLDSYNEKKRAYLNDKADYDALCKKWDDAKAKHNDAIVVKEYAVKALTNAYKGHKVSDTQPSCTVPEYVDYLKHIDDEGYSWADFAEKYREQLKGFTFTYNSNTTHGVLDTLAKSKSEPSSRQLFVLKKLKEDILNGTIKHDTEDDSTTQSEPKQNSFEKHPDWIVLGDMELYLCKSVLVHNDVLDTKISRTVSYQGNMSERQSRHVTDYLVKIVNEIFKTIDSSTEYEAENKNGLLAVKGVCDETQFDSWFKNYLDANSDWVSKLNANADIADKLDISKFSQLVNQN